MSLLRNGQSQVLTAVILGGIIVGAITSAFMWGVPLLEKNQDVNTARSALQDMKKLSAGIEEVAKEHGSQSVPVRLGSGTLRINTTGEEITYQAMSKGAYVSTENWVPLNENDVNGVPGTDFSDSHGIRGVDKAGVLVGQASQASQGFVTRYRIVFRPLKDPDTGQTYQVNLVPTGNQQVSGGGEHTVVFERGDTTTEPGNGVDGGTLHRIEVLVRIT